MLKISKVFHTAMSTLLATPAPGHDLVGLSKDLDSKTNLTRTQGKPGEPLGQWNDTNPSNRGVIFVSGDLVKVQGFDDPQSLVPNEALLDDLKAIIIRHRFKITLDSRA